MVNPTHLPVSAIFVSSKIFQSIPLAMKMWITITIIIISLFHLPANWKGFDMVDYYRLR
jgi:hypothetical protein